MNDFITAKDAAPKWNMSVYNIQNLCAEGKLDGVVHKLVGEIRGRNIPYRTHIDEILINFF